MGRQAAFRDQPVAHAVPTLAPVDRSFDGRRGAEQGLSVIQRRPALAARGVEPAVIDQFASTRPAPKGWCPSLYEPMAAGDGLLARVKPGIHGLSAAQLRALADAAGRYGSGRVEITNRANLQVRGLRPDTAPLFATAMLEGGLAHPDPAIERRRNILLPACPTPVVIHAAEQLDSWLPSEAGLERLPAKFGFAVAEGGQEAGQPEADIQIVLGHGWPRVTLAGANIAAETASPIEAAGALTRAFLALAPLGAPPHRRMKALVAALGPGPVFAAAGLPARAMPQPVSPATLPVGAAADLCALGLPLGAADAALLHRAADIADHFRGAMIRVTASRLLLLTGLGDRAAEAAQAAAASGFIIDPTDPRLRIAACAGRPACPSAAADVRAAAEELAPYWRDPGRLHVSGCAKGCAHPASAAMTLIASEAGYGLVRDDRASAAPERTALALAEAAQIIRDRHLAAV